MFLIVLSLVARHKWASSLRWGSSRARAVAFTIWRHKNKKKSHKNVTWKRLERKCFSLDVSTSFNIFLRLSTHVISSHFHSNNIKIKRNDAIMSSIIQRSMKRINCWNANKFHYFSDRFCIFQNEMKWRAIKNYWSIRNISSINISDKQSAMIRGEILKKSIFWKIFTVWSDDKFKY